MNRTIANLISRAESPTHTASRPGLYTRFFEHLIAEVTWIILVAACFVYLIYFCGKTFTATRNHLRIICSSKCFGMMFGELIRQAQSCFLYGQQTKFTCFLN